MAENNDCWRIRALHQNVDGIDCGLNELGHAVDGTRISCGRSNEEKWSTRVCRLNLLTPSGNSPKRTNTKKQSFGKETSKKYY